MSKLFFPIFILLTSLFFVPAHTFALDIKTDFVESFVNAHEAKSEPDMDKLFSWQGVSKFQKRKLTAYTHGFFGRKIRDISFNSVTNTQYSKVKLGNKTFSSNLPIIYEMRVVYSDATGNGDVPIVYLVGQDQDSYYFSVMIKEKNT